MKELLTRSISGIIYIALLVVATYSPHALFALFFIFGLISINEFSRLIGLKGIIPYVVFILLYSVFTNWSLLFSTSQGIKEATQILLVITIFVKLFLIKDLFSEKTIPLFEGKRYLLTTFYLTSGFTFLVLMANAFETFTPHIVLGSFILVWVNDSFAYLVGKNFGRQKLFESISPKKTVEGFLGGLFFSCVASYFIANFTETISFTNWLILAIIMSVFGTLGDLVESKFKRQANVKDSGNIMPGHGGLLDRLDSIVFASSFIYLFIRILNYVS